MKGSRIMTATPHWHVERRAEDDSVYTSDSMVDALEYAANELDRAAEFATESITIHGEAGEFETAYGCYVQAERFDGLAANAHNIHRQDTLPLEQRAPLYQVDGDQHAEAIRRAGVHCVEEINANGPKNFHVWECAAVPCEIAEVFEESD
jgi:hypothetical protein